MIEKIMGIITLKAPVYKAVAEDQSLTKTAGIIVAIVTFIQGFCYGLTRVDADGVINPNIGNAIIQAFANLVLGLIAWYIAAWLLAVIAKAFGGSTDTGEMLRVTGFVQVFGLTGIFNLVALISSSLVCVTSIISLAILVLSLIGYFIGVREAAEFSTGKAVITALIAAVASFIINSVISGAVTSFLPK